MPGLLTNSSHGCKLSIDMKKLKKIKHSPSLHKSAKNNAYTKDSFSELALKLSKQIDKQLIENKHLSTKHILILAGAGLFMAGSVIAPNISLLAKPLLLKQKRQEYEVWKRFNIPYLKRKLKRLEKQKLIEIIEQKNRQVITITESGKKKTLKFAIDSLAIEKPKRWDKKWRLVSYDIPKEQKRTRQIFYEYLHTWHFYPLHESVLLHAYPCEEQVEFLRNYLGIEKYVRIFTVSKIENDKPFRDFFDI